MGGAEDFAAFLDGVEALVSLNVDVARESAAAVRAEVAKTAASGTTPYGEAWPVTVDGGKPLPGVGDAISVETRATRIMLRIGPPWVFHHYGAGGSSQTKAAKARRRYTERKRAEAAAAGKGVRSRFHAPRRQVLPDPGQELPPRVRAVLVANAKRIFSRAMGGG